MKFVKDPKLIRWLIALSGGGALLLWALVGWVATEEVFHATEDAAFCGTCHVMAPMIAAYEQDPHGGRNVHGIKAVCLDCHLPHESAWGYAWAKAQTGTHDVWAQLTYDLTAIDWEAKRERRSEYTYDSGCLACHQNLEQATMASNKAFVAHRPYFQKTTRQTCVSCHPHVGHTDLTEQLTSKEFAQF